MLYQDTSPYRCRVVLFERRNASISIWLIDLKSLIVCLANYGFSQANHLFFLGTHLTESVGLNSDCKRWPSHCHREDGLARQLPLKRQLLPLRGLWWRFLTRHTRGLCSWEGGSYCPSHQVSYQTWHVLTRR